MLEFDGTTERTNAWKFARVDWKMGKPRYGQRSGRVMLRPRGCLSKFVQRSTSCVRHSSFSTDAVRDVVQGGTVAELSVLSFALSFLSLSFPFSRVNNSGTPLQRSAGTSMQFFKQSSTICFNHAACASISAVIGC